MKLIITFCEGWHDAAFIYKLLKNKSYQYKNDKIADLPNILRNYFKELFKNFEYSDTGKIKQNPDYPNYLLKKKNEDIYILLYSIGGVDKLKNALPIIETFKDLSEATLDTPEIPIALHFILDAEDLNIQQRIDKIVEELKTEIDLSGLTQGKILNENLSVKATSVYIFSDKKKNNGKLEDILIPLMKKDNEEIFEQAEKYIKNNYNKTRNKKNQNLATHVKLDSCMTL